MVEALILVAALAGMLFLGYGLKEWRKEKSFNERLKRRFRDLD